MDSRLLFEGGNFSPGQAGMCLFRKPAVRQRLLRLTSLVVIVVVSIGLWLAAVWTVFAIITAGVWFGDTWSRRGHQDKIGLYLPARLFHRSDSLPPGAAPAASDPRGYR